MRKCALQRHSICGGIAMCGDRPCRHLDCCSNGLTCTRANHFAWFCEPNNA
jgi:hypothetical protein